MSSDIRKSKRRYSMDLCCPSQAGDTSSKHISSVAVRRRDLVGQQTTNLPHKMS